jgi:type II secretory pathway pseudopilin PulG
MERAVSVTTMTKRRQRGTTLIEILISVAVVLVGMLALFQTLGTSVTGSSTASRMSQAQQRAVMIMESIRTAPAEALECLRTTAPTDWQSCEATCRNHFTALGYTVTQDICVFKTLTVADLRAGSDRSSQRYYLVTENSAQNGRSGGGISFVKLAGTGGRVYDAQVVVGWHDNNDGKTDTPDHFVALRSGVFQ